MELEKSRNNAELVDVSMEDTEGPNSSSKEIHVECAVELNSRALDQAFANHQSKEQSENNQ